LASPLLCTPYYSSEEEITFSGDSAWVSVSFPVQKWHHEAQSAQAMGTDGLYKRKLGCFSLT